MSQENDLYVACLKLAHTNVWRSAPVDVDQIASFAKRIYEVALKSFELLEGSGHSLETITKAVYYIEQAHAIPPIGPDTKWFEDTLSTLLGIIYPNTQLSGPALEFVTDLKVGLESIKQSDA